jgi:predicted metal-dependent HD superfamily phosphohydrolase
LPGSFKSAIELFAGCVARQAFHALERPFDMTALERAWNRCFIDLDTSCPPPHKLEELQARYSEPHRAYHTLQHIEECLGWFERTRALATNPGEVAVALLYHDAIYDTHARDNEERSAQLALEVCETDSHQSDRIKSLILATKHDALPRSRDEQLLVDIDLSILGASEDRFDEYEQQVRKEYAWVDEPLFRTTRRSILAGFLSHAVLYATPFLHERLEDAARANLQRSIVRLGD